MYPTNELRKGDFVEVVKQRDDGWLEIKPPPGSFSWINHRFVTRTDKERSWAVDAHPEVGARVLIGSRLKKDKPTVYGPTVGRGHQVVVIGEPLMDTEDNTKWLPILPTPSEVRYLKADQVTRLNTSGPTTPTGPPAAPAASPETRPTPAPMLPTKVDPLWLQAQQAEQAGQWQEAVQCYTELGKKAANSDHGLAMQCFNKADYLRKQYLGSAPVSSQPARPPENRFVSSGTDNRLQPIPAGTTGPGVSRLGPPQAASAPRPAPSGQGGVPGAPVPWSGPGRLRLAGRCVDCKRTYVLETSQGQPLTYVAGQPGLDLEAFVGQNVEVTGAMVYRTDLRAYYLTATRVNPLR
jgi:hypothetical protein